MRQVRGERRRGGSKGSRRGSDVIRRWMLTRKVERRTKYVMGRRKVSEGKPSPGAFL